MNMSRLMSDINLLTLCCFMLVCIYGKGQDLFPCEVDVKVWRGTTWKTVPQQPLTVRCPVKHCGESHNVTWCKLLDKNICVPINYTENVEIRQNDTRVQNELISYLTFTRISIHDNGLYRCTLKGHTFELISHIINISVSDSNQGVQNPDYNADELPSAEGDDEAPCLPCFSISVSIALVVTLTVATVLSYYLWKRRVDHTEGQAMQEKSSCMIPDVPNGSAPSTLILHHTSPSTAERPPSQPPLMTNGNEPAVANTESGRVVYAVVSPRHTGIPVREQHAETKLNENAGQAAFSVS